MANLPIFLSSTRFGCCMARSDTRAGHLWEIHSSFEFVFQSISHDHHHILSGWSRKSWRTFWTHVALWSLFLECLVFISSKADSIVSWECISVKIIYSIQVRDPDHNHTHRNYTFSYSRSSLSLLGMYHRLRRGWEWRGSNLWSKGIEVNFAYYPKMNEKVKLCCPASERQDFIWLSLIGTPASFGRVGKSIWFGMRMCMKG